MSVCCCNLSGRDDVSHVEEGEGCLCFCIMGMYSMTVCGLCVHMQVLYHKIGDIYRLCVSVWLCVCLVIGKYVCMCAYLYPCVCINPRICMNQISICVNMHGHTDLLMSMLQICERLTLFC